MPNSNTGERRRLEILQTAKTLFGKYGLKKTSLRDISKSLGLVKSAIYHYFSSKEDLFSEVIKHESDILFEKLNQEIDRYDSPVDQLKTYILKRIEHIQQHVNLNNITKEAVEELFPMAIKVRSRFVDREKRLLEELIRRGIDAGMFKPKEPEILSVAIGSIIKGIETSFFLYRDRQMSRDDKDLILDILLNGIMYKK